MTRFLVCVALLAVAAGYVVGAQERTDLTTPIAKPAISSYQIQSLLLEPLANRITVDLLANNGEHVLKVYNQDTTPTGASLLSSLNTSNNSGVNPSLVKKVFNRLIADGVITGTVAGTPQ